MATTIMATPSASRIWVRPRMTELLRGYHHSGEREITERDLRQDRFERRRARRRADRPESVEGRLSAPGVIAGTNVLLGPGTRIGPYEVTPD